MTLHLKKNFRGALKAYSNVKEKAIENIGDSKVKALEKIN